METVVIVIHLMVVLALVLVVLLQRSEGGALGIGGGGGGGFMSSRGTANVLTRATAILAFAFFVTSIGLTLIAELGDRPGSVLDQLPETAAPTGENGSGNGILDSLKQQNDEDTTPAGPQVPSAQ